MEKYLTEPLNLYPCAEAGVTFCHERMWGGIRAECPEEGHPSSPATSQDDALAHHPAGTPPGRQALPLGQDSVLCLSHTTYIHSIQEAVAAFPFWL